MIARAAILASVIDDVIAHACEDHPAECCGLLVGTPAPPDDSGALHPEGRRQPSQSLVTKDVHIVSAFRARNEADDPVRRFVVSPEDHFRVWREVRRSRLAIVGFYHSHPSALAEPSETDLKEAAYAGHYYLIVGTPRGTPDIRLFRFGGTTFEQVVWGLTADDGGANQNS